MISLEGADSYFAAGGHVAAATWGAYSDEQRGAAVTGARRVLARGLRRALRDDEAPYREGDVRRDEFAVYEQALHMLVNGRVSDAQSGSPYPVAVVAPEEVQRATYYAEEALRWLGWNGAAVIRG